MPLLLDIVTPERLVVSEQVDSVVCPGIEGELGVLPHHAPLLTTLGLGELRIRRGTEEEFFAIAGGFLQVRPDRVVVMAERSRPISRAPEPRSSARCCASASPSGTGARAPARAGDAWRPIGSFTGNTRRHRLSGRHSA
jgi:ATP synthase F1 epsilon subunit